MAEDYNLNFSVNAKGVDNSEEQFLALGKSIDKARQELDKMRDSNEQGSAAFQQQKAELEQMEGAFRDLNKEMKGVDATFEEVYGEVQPLTTALGEAEDRLYQLALAGDTTSKEYQELLDKVAKYRKVQIETDQAVDGAATTLSQKMGNALQGAASGFAVVQGAMGLMGTESEEVEQALLKVNSAMALAQGIAGVQEAATQFGLASKATKAYTLVQKGLNLVLKANPFALIVTAVIGLIAYFATFTDAINVVKDGLMAVTDWLGITDSEAEEAAAKREQEAEVQRKLQEAEQKRAERLHNTKMTDLDNEIALARAQGKDTTKLQKKKIAEILKVKKAKLAELAVDEAIVEQQKQILIGIQARGGTAGQLAGGLLKEIDKRQQESEKLKAEISKLETDLKIVDIEFEKARKSRRQQKSKDTKEDEKADKKAEEERLKKIAKELEDERKRIANLKKLKEDFETSLEAETDIANQRLISEQEFEIQAVQDKYFNLIEQAKQYNLDTSVLVENQRIAEAEINKKYDDEAKAKQKEIDDKAKDDAEKLAMVKAQMAIDGLRLVSDVAQLFAGKSEKAARTAFNIKKAADIAQATMDGYKAVLSTYASTPGGPVLKGIAAGLAGGFAAIQIGKIASAKFEGASGGGGDLGSDVPSGGDEGGAGGSSALSPSFNIVGDTGLSQLAQIQQQPMQAFVVSGDVTSAQSLDRNKIQNATI